MVTLSGPWVTSPMSTITGRGQNAAAIAAPMATTAPSVSQRRDRLVFHHPGHACLLPCLQGRNQVGPVHVALDQPARHQRGTQHHKGRKTIAGGVEDHWRIW